MKHLREGHEIAELQNMVKNTTLPRHCGRPPHKVGASAGGNLTSDQLRSLITIHFPLAIPVLWDKMNPESAEQQAHEEWARIQALKQKHKAEEKQGDKETRQATKRRHEADLQKASNERPKKYRRRRKTQTTGEPTSNDELPPHAFEPEELNEIDAELRNHFSWRRKDAFVTLDQIEQGEKELRKYLNQCAELRGSEHTQPNHHFSTHIAEQMRRYGPMHLVVENENTHT
ncbi:unnamed protein product [Rhizoctonia solani]|uniref:Uncharacterized protein n=1 Tax=Rhizoctonia solani TaxID=456999 RepID=A0A8H2XZL6_9AGAM|nr:unnamed protein product [Rhizoctonia solani]